MSLTRTQLPVRLTPLVGREGELADIAGALRSTRLITLTGPGGAGKTRLALAAAQAAEPSFPAGARWVSLAQIEDPAIAGQAVAAQLDVPDTPGQDPVEAIAKHLAGQRVLVVVDNCEHLAETVAGLVEYLLAACPALVVLATSREALGVEGELSWQVPPLSLPPGAPPPTATGPISIRAVAARSATAERATTGPASTGPAATGPAATGAAATGPAATGAAATGAAATGAATTGAASTGPATTGAASTGAAAPTAAGLVAFDAVRLFEQRAQLVRPSFRVTDENAAAVLAICRRLDGLPLAIELAAARMRILSSDQLAERMDDIFAVLVGGARSAPPRHQALRATLDWSYDLLEEDERAVFRRLAAFAGGFTLPAAERIVATGDIRPNALLELLTRLADKSLLRVEHDRSGTRYSLLATIRDYARDRLAEAGERAQVRRAHLEYFTELVQDAAARTDRTAELDRLDAELPNLRRAFDFAQETSDPEAALRIAGPLDRYAYLRGRYHEVRQWMDAAVRAGDSAPAALRAQALLGGGRLALLQCDYAPAVRRLEAALRLYRELDDPRGISGSLQVLGSVAREQGRYARAMELHAESLAVAEAAGDRWAAASARGYLAFASWLQRDYARAAEEAGLALAEFRALGDVEGTAWSLISLGTAARYQGDAERASELLTESLSLAEGIGFREGIAWSAEQLGLLAATDGDPVAIGLLRRSLDLHSELRDRWRMASVLEDFAAVALAQHDPSRAARLLGAAEALRNAIGTVIAPCERPQHNQVTRAVRAALGDEAFDAALRQGQLASSGDLTADLPAAPARGRPAPHQDARRGHGGDRRRRPDGGRLELRQAPRADVPARLVAAGNQGPDRGRAVARAVPAAARQRAAHGAARAAPGARRPRLGALRRRPVPVRPVPAARVRRDRLRRRADGRAPGPPGRGGPARAAAGHRRVRRGLPRRHGGRRMGPGPPRRAAPRLRVGAARHRPPARRGRPSPGGRGRLPPGRRARAAERVGSPGTHEQLGRAG
jgi:predicted ATPase